MDFIVDTAGDDQLLEKSELLSGKEKPYFVDKEDRIDALLDLFDKKKEQLDHQETAEENVQNKLKGLKIDELFNDFFEEMSWTDSLVKQKIKRRMFHFDQLDVDTCRLKSKIGSVDVAKEMKTSVLQPGMEKDHSLPRYTQSDKTLKALRKKERAKTKGPGWFNMAAPEVTEEMKNDLQVLKMRSALDPKHFYKKNDMETLPKYFQVGRIMDSPLVHVNERITKKQRKRTMVDELLDDAAFQKYNKKKYKEIIDDKKRTEYRTHMRDRRQKSKVEAKKNKMSKKKPVK